MTEDEIVTNCLNLLSGYLQCEHLADETRDEIIKEDISCIIQKIRQMDFDEGIRKFLKERGE